jgi:hypothetical protein
MTSQGRAGIWHGTIAFVRTFSFFTPEHSFSAWISG